MATLLILEPIFEADFQPGSYGYRPKRTAHQAANLVATAIVSSKTKVYDVDLRGFFDHVRHHILLEKVARRVNDPAVMGLLKRILKSSGKKGVPQGGVISPMLSNIYLNGVDQMLEKAKEVTREGRYVRMEYARYADDLVILVDGHRRHEWLLKAVDKRFREEMAKLQVEINEEKSRTVDLAKGDSFTFLGFQFRRLRSKNGKGWPYYTPEMKKRTALLRRLKDIFNRFRSQPVDRVVFLINPILRGWVNYFAIGHSSRCLSYIKDWVYKRIRRHLMRARKRPGYGWNRWSRLWVYGRLGLFNAYRIQRHVQQQPKALLV